MISGKDQDKGSRGVSWQEGDNARSHNSCGRLTNGFKTHRAFRARLNIFDVLLMFWNAKTEPIQVGLVGSQSSHRSKQDQIFTIGRLRR